MVLAGSVLRASCPLLTHTITDDIQFVVPQPVIAEPRDEPVVGAMLGALGLGGASVDAATRGRLGETAAATLDAT